MTALQKSDGQTGHTPGPWAFDPDDLSIYYDDGDVAPLVAEVNFEGVSPFQATADARLIAAAPELLAALQHMLGGALSLPRFAEQEARAAIAKATGEAA